MLLSWVVFRGLNFAVALNQLPVLITPIRKTEQFFRIKLASFRRDQGGTVKVYLKSISMMI
ncbi:hypothetical protein A9262_10725 [Vibrio splendidus]|nr:hypothetical protein A9262_10725 [Vibrio splendidus]